MKSKIALLLVFFIVFSINVFAKEGKLKFGKYIYYIGNIENNKMDGNGTLYIKTKKVGGDEISGVFKDNKISSCSIKFRSGWKYKGNAIISISEKDNELKLLLYEGIITTSQGQQISEFENLQYTIKVKKINGDERFAIEFNKKSFIAVLNNFFLSSEINTVCGNEDYLEGFEVKETGTFQGRVEISVSPYAPFKWDCQTSNGRFTTLNGDYFDIIDFRRNTKEYSFADILIKNRNGDYILYGGPRTPMQKNCMRYVKEIRQTALKTPTDSIIIEGSRKRPINRYTRYIFEGRISFAEDEYFEGEFKFNCKAGDKFETTLRNLKESDISFIDGEYHYNKTIEIWKNREFIHPNKIIKAGEELSFNITIDKPSTILSYLPLDKLEKIDSLTITGFLYETDIAVINKCKFLRYLDLSRTFIMYSPQAKQQQINEVKAAIAILNFAGMNADLKYNDGDMSSMEYIVTKAMAELGEIADKHVDEMKQIKQANENCIIPESAFKNMKFLKTVKLPITAIAIKEDAFYHCESLENIQLPPYLKSISEKAFAYCFNLRSLDFPSTITEIGKNAFEGSNSLKKVDLSKNRLKSIYENSLFSGNNKEIRLPQGIGYCGFYNKNCIIYYPKSLKEIGGKVTNCELHFSSPTAPLFDSRPIYGHVLQDNKIYVPKGCTTAYYVALGEKNTYIEE